MGDRYYLLWGILLKNEGIRLVKKLDKNPITSIKSQITFKMEVCPAYKNFIG